MSVICSRWTAQEPKWLCYLFPHSDPQLLSEVCICTPKTKKKRTRCDWRPLGRGAALQMANPKPHTPEPLNP